MGKENGAEEKIKNEKGGQGGEKQFRLELIL